MFRRLPLSIAAICLVLSACSSSAGQSTSRPTDPARPNVSTNPVTVPVSSVSWPRLANQSALIGAAHLPALSAEGTFEHYHAHLDVIVDGRSILVPGGLGIDVIGPKFSPLHTHDATGMVHIESTTHTEYTLGELFTEWNVRLTPDCVGTFCNGADRQMIVAVNGQAFTGDPSSIVFEPHQEIAIWSASPTTAADLPSSYNFPAGA